MTRVLIVEDDDLLNKTITKYLSNNGFGVVSCFGADEAYNKICEGVFDIIISDIMMPRIDGFEFLEAVRDINTEIPVIFMSANDDINFKQKGYRLGVDG